MFCKSCGADVPAESGVCPQCGAAAGEPAKQKPKGLAVSLVVLALAVVAAAAVFLQWLSGPEQRLRRALDQQELSLALRICEEELKQMPQWLAEEILNRLESLEMEYAAGTLAYDSVEEALKVYEQMGIDGTGERLAQTWQLVDAVKASREAYAQGQRMEAVQNYPAAIDSYAQVIDADTACYERALRKIVECQDACRQLVLAEAAAFAAAQLYDEAIEKLRLGLEILPEDTVLLEQLQSYSDADAEKKRNALLSEAAAWMEKGDYPMALSLLAGGQEDTAIGEAYWACREEYAQATEERAAQAFGQEGYTAAVEVVEECLQAMPEHERMLELKAYYESYAPVYLAELTIYDSTCNHLYRNGHTQDQQENTYVSSLAVDKGSISFRTDGAYALFSGTVACPYGYEYDKYRTGAWIEIYADDVLLYRSELTELESEPQSFLLEITGAQTVTITWISQGDNIWDNWGYRATLFDGVFYRHGQ